MVYTVQQLARMAGISTRTLHYYDEIGLLEPSSIRENGYRSYEDQELIKLQQILFFRELEFPLDEIKRMINSSGFNTEEALLEQEKLLIFKRERINKLLKTIQETKKGGGNMKAQKLFDGFDEKQLEEYKEEAKRRWGNTDAYKQSIERTKNWTKDDYKRIVEDGKKFNQKLADTMDKGYDSDEFQSLIAQHYKSIGMFYDCSLDMYRMLGEMYVSDPRFKANYDKFRPGLGEVMKRAIDYYADNQGKE